MNHKQDATVVQPGFPFSSRNWVRRVHFAAFFFFFMNRWRSQTKLWPEGWDVLAWVANFKRLTLWRSATESVPKAAVTAIFTILIGIAFCVDCDSASGTLLPVPLALFLYYTVPGSV